VGSVPRDVARDAIAVFNASTTRRVRGDFALASGDTVRGDVATLGGRARIDGVITGQLVVLNGDVVLSGSGRIERSLTVIGGEFESAERPAIGGEISIWSARLRYREEADTLVADADREIFPRWTRWQRDDSNGSQSQLFLTSAHTYNRVEGLPIYLGPRLRVRNGNTRVEAEAAGILRTGTQLDWTGDNRGYRVRLELRQGRTAGVAIGGRLYDEVDAVERWQLSETEVGLSSFVFTRDYRDYWQRHGGGGYVSLFVPHAEIWATFGEERWSSRLMRNVPSLFYSNVKWRANPAMDDGVVRPLVLAGRYDTRNRPDHPRSGWWLQGEFEHGTAQLVGIAPTTVDVRETVPGEHRYSRFLLDIRRYTRLGPSLQLNLRGVGGGRVGAEPLPLQRRFAVSGIDALPGFDFRQTVGATDAGTCATGEEGAYERLGRPAQCERLVLLQSELKGDFRINLFDSGDGMGDSRWMPGPLRADGAWVLFANTGRGWLVGEPTPDLRYSGGKFPPTRSWRTDVGLGLDFGDFGVYVAQAVSQTSLRPNVYMRLGHRF
jgi:hypothetical protein